MVIAQLTFYGNSIYTALRPVVVTFFAFLRAPSENGSRKDFIDAWFMVTHPAHLGTTDYKDYISVSHVKSTLARGRAEVPKETRPVPHVTQHCVEAGVMPGDHLSEGPGSPQRYTHIHLIHTIT